MATAQELLQSGMTPKDIRMQQIAQRKGIPQMEAEKKAAERFRSQQFGNINDYRDALGNLDPNVSRRVRGFAQIKQQQNKRISIVDSKIQQAQQKLIGLGERIKKAQQRDDEDREDSLNDDVRYYQEYIGGLNEGKDKLEKGDIIEPKKIESFARSKGQVAEQNMRIRRQNKEAQQKAVKAAEQKAISEGGFVSGGIIFDKSGSIQAVTTKEGEAMANKFIKPMTGSETQTGPNVLGLEDLNRDRSGDGWEVILPENTKTYDTIQQTIQLTPTIPEDIASHGIRTEPYIEKRVVDVYEGIPFTETVYIDPKGQVFDADGAEGYVSTERPATAEERSLIEKQQTALTLENTSGGPPSKIYQNIVEPIRIAYDRVDWGERVIEDEFLTKGQDFLVRTETKPLELIGLESGDLVYDVVEKGAKFKAAAVRAFIPETKGEIVMDAATLGVGYGAGFLISGAGKVASSIPKVGKFTGAAFSTVKVGAGVYLGGTYALTKGSEIVSAETYEEKGEIFGSTAKELTLVGLGYSKGAKFADIIEGKILTRGRTEIPLAELTQAEVISGTKSFPTASKSKQIEMFKKGGKIPDEGPGAFHATGDRFWKSGEINPTAGTSELPGLYGGTDVSIHFARISGGSSGNKNILPKFTELFTADGKPGIAYIKPSKFRYSPFSKVNTYEIGGQKFNFAFNQPPKPGVADIPLMKTEIEALFRLGTGPYSFESGKYFTTIKDVPVPIDVFGYETGLSSTSTLGKVASFLKGGQSSYEIPVGSSVSEIAVTSLAGGSLLSSSNTEIPSVVRVTSSKKSGSKSTPKSSYEISSYLKSSAPKSSPKPSSSLLSSEITSSYAPKSSKKSSAPKSSPIISEIYGSSTTSRRRLQRSPPPEIPGYPRKRKPRKTKLSKAEKSIQEASIFPVGFTAASVKIRRKIKRSELGRLARDPYRAIGIRALPVFELENGKKKTRKLKKKKTLRKTRSEVESILP